MGNKDSKKSFNACFSFLKSIVFRIVYTLWVISCEEGGLGIEEDVHNGLAYFANGFSNGYLQLVV
jgi:hypothetical protein